MAQQHAHHVVGLRLLVRIITVPCLPLWLFVLYQYQVTTVILPTVLGWQQQFQYTTLLHHHHQRRPHHNHNRRRRRRRRSGRHQGFCHQEYHQSPPTWSSFPPRLQHLSPSLSKSSSLSAFSIDDEDFGTEQHDDDGEEEEEGVDALLDMLLSDDYVDDDDDDDGDNHFDDDEEGNYFGIVTDGRFVVDHYNKSNKGRSGRIHNAGSGAGGGDDDNTGGNIATSSSVINISESGTLDEVAKRVDDLSELIHLQYPQQLQHQNTPRDESYDDDDDEEEEEEVPKQKRRKRYSRARAKSSKEVDKTSSTSSSSAATVSTDEVSYFYLRFELKLDEDVMNDVVTMFPQLLGFRASTIRNKVEVLTSLLDLSQQELRQLVSSNPGILRYSASNNISPTIFFLIRTLGLTKRDLRTLVMGCPRLFGYSTRNLWRKITFFTMTLQFSTKETRSILLKYPSVLMVSVQAGLVPRLKFLHGEVQIGAHGNINDLRTIIKKNPMILKMNIEDNLQPKLISFLILTVGMTPIEVTKMLRKDPTVLKYSLERKWEPIYRYFTSQDIIGFTPYEFSKVIMRFPKLLTMTLARVKNRVGYFRFELMMDSYMVRRIIHQNPQLFGLSEQSIRTRIDFLLDSVAPGMTLSRSQQSQITPTDRYDENNVTTDLVNVMEVFVYGDFYDDDDEEDDEWSDQNERDPETTKRQFRDELDRDNQQDSITFDKKSRDDSLDDIRSNEDYQIDDLPPLYLVQTILSGMPSLLNLKVETNLKPKVDFLKECLGQDQYASALMSFPPILGYSLEKRIRPRLTRMMTLSSTLSQPPSKNTTADAESSITQLLLDRFKVAMYMTDSSFDDWLESRPEKIKEGRPISKPLRSAMDKKTTAMSPKSGRTSNMIKDKDVISTSAGGTKKKKTEEGGGMEEETLTSKAGRRKRKKMTSKQRNDVCAHEKPTAPKSRRKKAKKKKKTS